MTINRTNLTWSENNRVNRLLRRRKRDPWAFSDARSIETEATMRELMKHFVTCDSSDPNATTVAKWVKENLGVDLTPPSIEKVYTTLTVNRSLIFSEEVMEIYNMSTINRSLSEEVEEFSKAVSRVQIQAHKP